MTPRDLALQVWLSELGRPYRWGGDNPMTGFDCSGFAIEGLKAAGVFPREGDSTAEGLRHRYPPAPVEGLLPGDLLFWADASGKYAGHVECVLTVINGEAFTIGASGGGHLTTSEAAASASDAYVKIRPAREGWRWPVRPF